MPSVIQYELWRECNSMCKFCTLGNDNRTTSKEHKIQALDVCLQELPTFNKDTCETIGFIGGEFFQGQLQDPSVKEKFIMVMQMANKLLNAQIIQTVWLNATLTIGNQQDLYDTVNCFDQKDKVWLLTSFDTLGRFHTPKMLETWHLNMQKLKTEYSEVKLNITSILTGDLIEKYINNEVDLYEHSKQYNTALFLKNTCGIMHIKDTYQDINEKIGYFYPKREHMLKFFTKYLQQYGVVAYNNLISTDLRADEIRKNYNDSTKRNLKFIRNRETLIENEEGTEDNLLSCGHNDIYQIYCDSEECILCDKQRIKELYQ